jgi:glutamate formiminotransferase/formiminotetrahydrofolate cyclodeaminase
MRQHRGIHPRFGSTDVCPFIPLRNITSDHCIALAKQLGKRVGDELKIPVYLYELAATTIDRKNLANVRKGEYEGLAEKMLDPQWQPDFGPHEFNAKNGAIAIGARPLLIAYNVNIAGESLEAAKIIAGTIRESGRRDPISGNQLAGKFKSVKAKAWYLAQYQRTQVTMNLSDYRQTSMHAVYETISELAASEKITVTGSQLVGMAPKEALIQSGIYYWKRKNPHLSDNSALEIPTEALIQYAVTALGLEEFGKFHFNEKVLDQSRL